MTAAEVLARHRKLWSDSIASCSGCDWSRFGNITRTDAAHAAHQLDALKAAGYAVVELPKLMVDRSNVAEVLRSLPMWTAGDAWTCLREPNLMEFEADSQNVYGELDIQAARNLAAALLAAANSAEATS